MSDNINVLVVDDIEKNLITMQAVLERPGINVLKAASGTEALELLLRHEVALVLVDVNMPEMDGFELAEIIRGNSRTRAIPLIFITAALKEPAGSFRAYKTGAVDFLNKPFDPDIVRSKVDVFVELYSQRKQLASQLEKLQQALHVNETFAAVLGHDLRTPLSAVINGAELIRTISDHSNVVSTATRIQASAQRMAMMVNQLLDFASARTGKVKLNLATNDYGAVCSQIIHEFANIDEPRPITLQRNGNASGIFDKDRVSQILSNLIGNALKHGDPDCPVTVNIDGSDKEWVVIQVHNQGSILDDQLAKIFEPYYSVPVERHYRQGLGLGLYIVRQLVQAHGGDVTVQSAPSEGTLFEIRMPRGA